LSWNARYVTPIQSRTLDSNCHNLTHFSGPVSFLGAPSRPLVPSDWLPPNRTYYRQISSKLSRTFSFVRATFPIAVIFGRTRASDSVCSDRGRIDGPVTVTRNLTGRDFVTTNSQSVSSASKYSMFPGVIAGLVVSFASSLRPTVSSQRYTLIVFGSRGLLGDGFARKAVILIATTVASSSSSSFASMENVTRLI
jgi:hypothetical protein